MDPETVLPNDPRLWAKKMPKFETNSDSCRWTIAVEKARTGVFLVIKSREHKGLPVLLRVHTSERARKLATWLNHLADWMERNQLSKIYTKENRL